MIFYPLVSIVIPVFNGSNFIDYAINSALNQTYKNIEIIVVNDGSTDNGETRKCVEKYLPKIRYYEKPNGGVSSALNYGIRQATGSYFVWLSHDDMLSPMQIESEVKTAKRLPNNYIIFCSTTYVDGNGNVLHKLTRRIPFYQHCFTNSSLLFDYSINGCSLLIPIQFVTKSRFDERLKYIPDTMQWFRLLGMGAKFWYLHKRLAISRIHARQVTNTSNPKLFEEEYSAFIAIAFQYCLEKSDYRSISHLLRGLALRKKRYPFEGELYRQYHAKAKQLKMSLFFNDFVCVCLSFVGGIFH